MTSRLDTTLRPYTMFQDGKDKRNISAETAAQVGAAGLKKYEYALYVLGQLARIVYCDAGIGRLVIVKALGLSPDIVNQVITDYDWNYLAKRRTPVSVPVGQTGATESPMESYLLKDTAQANLSGQKFGTYISTPEDFTALVLNTTQIKPNPNSIWKPSDVIVVIKGSSTLENFKDDLLSQFTPKKLETFFAEFGFQDTSKTGVIVPASFVNPILKAWPILKKVLTEHVKEANTRVFVTGHSLGGAYASLLTFILALAKNAPEKNADLAFLNNIQILHNVTFGAPTIVSDKARNVFNEFLKSGLVTLDRVVAQKVASRSAAVGAALQGASTLLSPNDVIPLIPAGFAHPGYRPLTTNYEPEAGGRPYSIDIVRKFFGVESKTRWRDQATWPFTEPMNMPKEAVQAKARELTGLKTAPDSFLKESQTFFTSVLGKASVPKESETTPLLQDGGAFLNTLKSTVSKVADTTARTISKVANKTINTMSGPEKKAYKANTQTMLPNFLSVEQETTGYIFAHAGYMGMTYWGAFRMAGMKNPSHVYPAYFSLFPTGVKGEYVTTGAKTGAAPPAQQSAGGRRKQQRKSRKANKGRKGTRKH